MPEPELNVPYPVIDTDPTFDVVCRSFRPSDYACWALSTAGFPAALLFLGKAEHALWPNNTNQYLISVFISII
jgi:hypothetical protein